MKNLLLAGALALGLSACAAGTNLGTELAGAVQWIDAPATQQALLSFRTLTTALVCDISAGSSLASDISTAVKTKASVQGDINLLAVGSAKACAGLGGTLTGQTVSNAQALVTK